MQTAITVLLGIFGILLVILVFLPQIAGRYSHEDLTIRYGRHVMSINLRRVVMGVVGILSLVILALYFLP